MTNDELKALCERVLADDPKMTVHPVRLADECLRLLAQCDAMRRVVEAAKACCYKDGTALNYDAGLYEINKLIEALSQLAGERT